MRTLMIMMAVLWGCSGASTADETTAVEQEVAQAREAVEHERSAVGDKAPPEVSETDPEDVPVPDTPESAASARPDGAEKVWDDGPFTSAGFIPGTEGQQVLVQQTNQNVRVYPTADGYGSEPTRYPFAFDGTRELNQKNGAYEFVTTEARDGARIQERFPSGLPDRAYVMDVGLVAGRPYVLARVGKRTSVYRLRFDGESVKAAPVLWLSSNVDDGELVGGDGVGVYYPDRIKGFMNWQTASTDRRVGLDDPISWGGVADRRGTLFGHLSSTDGFFAVIVPASGRIARKVLFEQPSSRDEESCSRDGWTRSRSGVAVTLELHQKRYLVWAETVESQAGECDWKTHPRCVTGRPCRDAPGPFGCLCSEEPEHSVSVRALPFDDLDAAPIVVADNLMGATVHGIDRVDDDSVVLLLGFENEELHRLERDVPAP